MRQRIPEIEGIRGVLSLIVLAGHISILHGWLFWYWGCMDIFFCVSGYVITRLIIRNLGREGFLLNYFSRRVLRIWPMYFTAMVFAYAVTWATAGTTLIGYGYTGDWHPSRGGFWLPIFFAQNAEMYLGLSRRIYLTVFQHSWSVAVEEHFYALWPLLLLALRGIPVLTRILLAMALIALSAYLRAHGLFAWLLLTRLDGFVLGAALAFIEAAIIAGHLPLIRVQQVFRYLWLWPCLMLLPFLSHGYFGIDWKLPYALDITLFDSTFNFALFAFALIGYCVLVPPPAANGRSIHQVLSLEPLQYCGTISYSTYLLHPPIVFIISPFLVSTYQLPSIFLWIISFGLTLMLASVTYKWIEAPAMRLKKSFASANGAAAGNAGKEAPAQAQPLPPARSEI